MQCRVLLALVRKEGNPLRECDFPVDSQQPRSMNHEGRSWLAPGANDWLMISQVEELLGNGRQPSGP